MSQIGGYSVDVFCDFKCSDNKLCFYSCTNILDKFKEIEQGLLEHKFINNFDASKYNLTDQNADIIYRCLFIFYNFVIFINRTSIFVRKNVEIASLGDSTIGSLLSLKDVFNTTGIPDNFSNSVKILCISIFEFLFTD